MSDFISNTYELEYKYLAGGITLKAFEALANSLKPIDTLTIGSWDLYYEGTNKALPFDFFRYRQGSSPELTIKIKLDSKNNNNRIEYDIPLNPNASEKDVEAVIAGFVGLLGFEFNVRIYKYCSIYFYEKTSLVYYTVQDEEMREIGRYVEVEANKKYPFASTEEAWETVVELEKTLEPLGITAKNRMRKSQWEINRKEKKSV